MDTRSEPAVPLAVSGAEHQQILALRVTDINVSGVWRMQTRTSPHMGLKETCVFVHSSSEAR
jgi:hypothetical protein